MSDVRIVGSPTRPGQREGQRPEVDWKHVQVISGLDCALFDLDGVVADSEKVAGSQFYEVVREYFQSRGITPPDKAQFKAVAAGKAVEEVLFDCNLRYPALQMTHSDSLRLIAEEHRRSVEAITREATPIPNIELPLITLQKANVLTALVSSSSRDRIDATLETVSMARHFDPNRIFSARSNLNPAAPKPSPEIYIFADKKLSAEFDGRSIRGPDITTVVTEDSESGITAALKAGYRYVVGFVGGSHIPEEDRIPLSNSFKKLQIEGNRVFDVIDDMTMLNAVFMEIATIAATKRKK